jgi:nucleoid DNA-binding protein
MAAKVTRSDLSDHIKKKLRFSRHDADNAAYTAVEWIADHIAAGDFIELRGLGTFYTENRPETASNLPTTRNIPPHMKARFKPGKWLKKELQSFKLGGK